MYRLLTADHAYVGKWIAEHGGGPYRLGAKCIGLERHGSLVAGTSYDHFNGASIVASIAIIGPVTKAWLRYIFAYPFVQLKAKVIFGMIAGTNIKSLRLVNHLGFFPVADIPDADPCGLLCIYALHREHCRYLKGRIHE